MILARFTGGLGNQMFQYAFGKSLALKNNVDLKLDDSLLGSDSKVAHLVVRNFDLDVFDLKDEWATEKEIALFNGHLNPSFGQKAQFKLNRLRGKFPLFIQEGHEVDYEKLNHIGEDVCIVGRWQSEEFFKDYTSEIKDLFSFSSFIPNQYSKDIAKEMSNCTAVTVQVRRGDYISNPKYAKLIGGLNKSYFIDAMALMQKKLSGSKDNVKFFFVSDDIEWCKTEFKEVENTRFVEQEKSKNGYVSDLWLLTQARNAIISNSTFSWWGAWLGEVAESVIIAPKQWTRDPNESSNKCVPSRWVTIDNSFEPLIK